MLRGGTRVQHACGRACMTGVLGLLPRVRPMRVSTSARPLAVVNIVGRLKRAGCEQRGRIQTPGQGMTLLGVFRRGTIHDAGERTLVEWLCGWWHAARVSKQRQSPHVYALCRISVSPCPTSAAHSAQHACVHAHHMVVCVQLNARREGDHDGVRAVVAERLDAADC